MINRIRSYLSIYHPKMPYVIVYMLQQVEYDPQKFGAWVDRFPDYTRVMHRQKLVLTSKAKMLVGVSYATWLLGLVPIIDSLASGTSGGFVVAMIFAILIPLFPMGAVVTAVVLGSVVNIRSNNRAIGNSKDIFANLKAVKVAVIGSYGKTTMKELLNTVISEGKKVDATPGNMNVQLSQAKFAETLSGDEEVVIIEFGEGRPGDIAKMSNTVSPDIAIITGLAPNHLDYYPSLAAVAEDLLSVNEFVKKEHVFVTSESIMLNEFIPEDAVTFGKNEALGWAISDISVSLDGLKFAMNKDGKRLNISSLLLGRHQVAPIALVASIAYELGLSIEQIESGCRNTVPFEHRMQPRNVHGAWLIDDTYNGNLEGMRAGLELLSELEAKRKWYITPGLVDQGPETERVHQELGKLIAESNPDIVVLMENSVRPIIESTIKENGFIGEIKIEKDPLEFYTNIEHVVAAGDLVLMQNDWTDNYN